MVTQAYINSSQIVYLVYCVTLSLFEVESNAT